MDFAGAIWYNEGNKRGRGKHMTLKIGENLKKLRRQNRLTQEQLADICHVTPQAVSRWEKESAYPNVFHFVTLANYFSVTIEELIGQEEFCFQETNKEETFKGAKNGGRNSELLDEVIRLTASVLCLLIEEKNNG